MQGMQPDNYTFPFVLKACAGLSSLKAGYIQIEHVEEALVLFHQMQLANVMPDSVTIVSVLSACSFFRDIEQGKQIHAYITKSGVDSDVFVETALLDMYAKCSNLDIANQFFEKMSEKDVVTWNAMLAGYAKSGHANEALKLFNQMQLSEATPNSVTMVNVLSACAHLGALHQGTGFHSYIIKRGFEYDIVVGTALVDMYAKCRTIDIAQQVFEMMSKRNVVSWSAMIAGYAQNEHANDALVLFNEMQLADVKPNSVTMVSVLSACAQLAAPQQGKWIHGYIIRCGFQSDLSVENSLLDMYAKCGRIDIARKLFDKMSKRDVISWNAMITGYGMHGHGEDALGLFNQMQQRSIKPNHVTFVSILSACSHTGLVELGWQYFNCMSREYHIIPNTKHYACMVDLLGRAGQLDEAHELIKGMPLESDIGVWGALLGACRIHDNTQLGEYVAKQLYDLEPENAGYYVLISNIYAAAGRWDDVAKVRDLMNVKGLKKTPGYSLIEVKNKVHTFLVGDRSHPQSEKIYDMLEKLAGKMEDSHGGCAC
jgi:pentatricopeptide repeat protein